ncbi:MAG TPA: glycine cleavage system aminomethyltransferase GcvT [Woeseiaceae bacterium]|nr:glycine cleavage system aminomethyltransferase GcvT [Woeseiaceae bacterium]
MGNRTPLYPLHVDAGARIVDFGGWDMPLAYGSQLEEHRAVRESAGMFDVSHMTVVDLAGEGVADFLARLLANDIGKIEGTNRALYTCMLNEDGGVLDDLIAYHRGPGDYRLVVNAATREKDIAWMRRQAGGRAVEITERADLAMLALQGPDAREKAAALLPADQREAALAMKPFTAGDYGDYFVARTGYTGEDGWEILAEGNAVIAAWRVLAAAGVRPCGLGARDTLRLEAGLNLYGSDMDETTTPLESNLGWTVAFDPPGRDFIGRAALERQKEAGVPRRLVGLVLEGKGVLRNHQTVLAGDAAVGEITSGGFGPTVGGSIALARIDAGAEEPLTVDIRGRHLPVRIVRPPFVRNGEVKV